MNDTLPYDQEYKLSPSLELKRPKHQAKTSLQSVARTWELGQRIGWSSFQFEKYYSLGIDITLRPLQITFPPKNSSRCSTLTLKRPSLQ